MNQTASQAQMRFIPASGRLLIKRTTALLLTFCAGFVDISAYLLLYRDFIAHMTGDTVHLGQALMQRRWADAVPPGCIILAFLVGSIIGRTCIEIGWRRAIRSIASVTLLIEAGLLVVVIASIRLGSPSWASTVILLAILAAAMGMQTATLTRVGSLTVHTTFVTGMLNKLAQLLSQALFLTFDINRGRPAAQQRTKVIRQASFIFSIWLLYLTGAVIGTLLTSSLGIDCLVIPVALILIAVALDQVAPLSIEEEQDQP